MRNDNVYKGERDGHGDFFVGALIGAAVGAAVALLYAPVRGSDAREMIADHVQEGLNRASATADVGRKLAEKGRELVAHSKDIVSDARDTLVQAAEDGRDAYRRVKANT